MEIYSVKTILGKIVATILMFMGIGLIGSLTSTISTYFINKESKKSKEDYKTKVLKDSIKSLQDFENISKEELKDIFDVLNTLKEK